MQRTGQRIQKTIKEAGYSVREIQEYLRLSCPQSIYRWFKGQILPSINHMYALSILLHVHMEELLVVKCEDPMEWMSVKMRGSWRKRFICYRNLLFRSM
ncbi:MAG: helix-turn-helix domain-containing protein [Clostridiales bacterium]|nr:helix-turn-helix domain-containing protein [Clostridiales bacterium]